jgi:hypothetical protein
MLFASGLFLLGDPRSMRQAVQFRARSSKAVRRRAFSPLFEEQASPHDEQRSRGTRMGLAHREARGASFTLIGQEQGVAETAQLSAALFSALRSVRLQPNGH